LQDVARDETLHLIFDPMKSNPFLQPCEKISATSGQIRNHPEFHEAFSSREKTLRMIPEDSGESDHSS